MTCSKPRMTWVLKIIPAKRGRRLHFPHHKRPSPMRVEKSKPATKESPHPLHTTHAPRNCTGIKNNTRTKEAKIDMTCSKPRMTRVLKIIPAYIKPQTHPTTHSTPTHDTGRKKIYLQNGKESTTPHAQTPSPMRVEKSKPTTKEPPHTLHTTHALHNCTGTKNNTRTQKSQMHLAPSAAPASRHG